MVVQKTILDPEIVSSCVRYHEFKDLVEFLPYGSPVRVMVLMLAFTGCRVSELDRMFVRNLHGTTLSWRLGKNQKGWRSETLPSTYILELCHYRNHHRTDDQRIFGFSGDTLRRRLAMVRPLVGGAWIERTSKRNNGSKSYVQYRLKLKGFRKNFQTILFKYYYDKYGDAGVALEFVSKRMKHSSTHMTAYHYIENFAVMDVTRWVESFFCHKPSYEEQKRLFHYE